MQYVIFDLEWNNSYYPKTGMMFNEIIEIGAVKLNSNLEIIGEFSQLIKSQFSRRLRRAVIELTNITTSEMKSGIVFTKALAEFRKWVGNEQTIVLTWSNSDIKVLLKNFEYLNGVNKIPFLEYYVDLQEYIQTIVNFGTADQIGLSAAAAALGISEENYSTHRALDDSKLSSDCFVKTFDYDRFNEMIAKCDDKFYERLNYKSTYITSVADPLFDKKQLRYVCEDCGKNPKQLTEWKVVNRGFRAFFYCKGCDKKTRVTVRFKKCFDKVEVKRNITTIIDTENEPDSETKNTEST